MKRYLVLLVVAAYFWQRVTPVKQIAAMATAAARSSKKITVPLVAPPTGSVLPARYVAGKGNVFFNERSWASDARDHVDELRAFLSDTRALESLPDSGLMESRPPILLQRMAAIDLLEAADAKQALGEIVRAEWPAAAPTRVKKILLAEKSDALTALTHRDPDRALSEYRDLRSPLLKARLRDAIVAGLVDRGSARGDALRRVVEISGSEETN